MWEKRQSNFNFEYLQVIANMRLQGVLMFKRFFKLATLLFVLISLPSFAQCGGDCCIQSIDFGFGWRRDNIKWKITGIEESSVDAIASSHLKFEDIESYTYHGKARWAGSAFYIRLAGDYGSTFKGHFHERFAIDSPLLGGVLRTHVEHPVKRKSEVFDFTGAVGYPFLTCDNCLMIVPVIGYSFHRQRFRVNDKTDNSFTSSNFSLESTNPFFDDSSPFVTSSGSMTDYSFNPFSSNSQSNIASLIGFSQKKFTENYRFTWYGPFVGIDLAWGLDEVWTLFTELEYHFLDRSNRKRKSYTAVDFVDDYHSKKWAYGFNGEIGTTIDLGSCWYCVIQVDFRFWKSYSRKHYHGSSYYDTSVRRKDDILWKSVGANIHLGYIF